MSGKPSVTPVREELSTNHEVIFRAANSIAIYRQRTVALRGANAIDVVDFRKGQDNGFAMIDFAKQPMSRV